MLSPSRVSVFKDEARQVVGIQNHLSALASFRIDQPLCPQYDVELIHHIEDLMGHQLAEFEMKESEVLKNITRVYAAKRSAQQRAVEDESKEGGKQQLVKHKLVRKKRKVERGQ